jgi:electron transport complex protein RnfD
MNTTSDATPAGLSRRRVNPRRPAGVRAVVGGLRGSGSVIGHTGFNVARYHSTHVIGALVPTAAGILFFGWRAVVSVLTVVATVYFATLIWRRVGTRGHTLRPALMLWLGTLLAIMLPARLAGREGDHRLLWPLLPAAGLLLVVYVWAVGAKLFGRVHPVVAVYLLLAACFGSELTGRGVLERHHVVIGDVLAAGETRTIAYPLAWRERSAGAYVLRSTRVADSLTQFTRGDPGRPDSIDGLLRGGLPPLEDLVLGATPGGIGTTSVVAVVLGGLFLIFRGLVDYRVPLWTAAAFWAAVFLLPGRYSAETPGAWVWLAGRRLDVGWPRAITLANYELLGTPLLFTAFFLAGSPFVRPMNRRSRTAFGILTGLTAAVCQLYVSAAIGSFVAVLLVGFLSPTLDRVLASPTLV